MLLKYFVFLHCVITAVFASILRDALASVNEAKLSELEGVIKKISKAWINHDAILVSHNNRSDDRVKEVTNMISSILVPLHPVYSYETSKSILHEVNGPLAATSRSFVFIVYGAPLAPNITDTVDIVGEIDQLSHAKHSPKILLILLVNQKNIQLNEQMKLMGKRDYLNVIVLEASFEDFETPMYVHSFRISSGYSRFPYNGDVSTWYEGQMRNISGTKFHLCIPEKELFYHELMNIYLTVLKETQNVSFTDEPTTYGDNTCNFRNSVSYLLYLHNYTTGKGHTVPVYLDQLCLFVPPAQLRKSETKWGLTIASILGIFIILLILGFSMLAKIRTFTYPFNVIAAILGVWIDSMRLSSSTEKIIYLCLVQVATRYTSMLYSEMFNEATFGHGEITIKNFEDLYGLNLTIKANPAVFDFFTGNNTIVPADLLHLFEKTENLQKAKEERHISYFAQPVLEAFLPKKIEVATRRRTQLCIGSVPVVHGSWANWPYADVVDDTLLRMNEYGIQEREDELMRLKNILVSPEEEQIDPGSSAQQKMMTGMLFGYLVAVVVLAAELVIMQFKKWRNTQLHRSFVRD